MSTPLISIIVPIYNVEAYLDRCIQSLLNQTLKNIEIILVDDESPDRCPQICEQYAALNPQIKVIHKKNEGLGYARNSGMQIATGKFIAFVDGDDFVENTMFEQLYNTATEQTADTVFCGFYFYKENTPIISHHEVDSVSIFDNEDIKNKILLNMIGTEPHVKSDRLFFMSVWHSIYSLSIIKENKILFSSEREIISEDIVFQMDYLTKSKRTIYIPNCLYYYCTNQTSLSRIFRKDRNSKILFMYQELIKKANKMKWNTIEKQRIMRLYIGYSRNAMIDLCLSNLKYKEKKKILQEICSYTIWDTIFSQYPYKKLPKIYSIFCLLVKYKLYYLIYCTSHIKNQILKIRK
jgi:glycosyltransferase involved in cell wall biosynthesis